MIKKIMLLALPVSVMAFFAACSACGGDKNKAQAGVESERMTGIDSVDSLIAAAMRPHESFRVVSYPTPNYEQDTVNSVEGVVLHHTAQPNVEQALQMLTSKERGVGTHVIIDTDGTRYILCKPTQVTYHAGPSTLHGKDGCNNFTVGIEFQGNTLKQPLTWEQILSAMDYLLPLIREYKIPYKNIVTHEMVRKAYKRKYPDMPAAGKVDITQKEYVRLMKVLRAVAYTESEDAVVTSP